MDYYFADRFLISGSETKPPFTEKIILLPAVSSFQPSMPAPVVNPLPALRNGYPTFGSFNRMSKLNPGVIHLWANLLKEVPKAHMLLGNLPAEHGADVLADWFQREGIGTDRLSFYSSCETIAYLGLHHKVDLCLDTFPYTGFTTTADSAWMGVPTLTWRGHSCVGRQSACLLSHMRLPDFIADDAADFVAKGSFWANNLEVLAEIRAGFRQRFLQSPVGQPEDVARSMLNALRTIWTRWCEGQPPESLP